MSGRLIYVVSALLLASVGSGSLGHASSDPEGQKLLRDEIVGYSLAYPASWRAGEGPLAATGFTPEALCRNVEIVDYEPPPGSGSGGATLHSFVQVCAKRLTDDSTLDDFMRLTYGSDVSSQFEPGVVADVPAYRGHADGQDLIFLQTPRHRIQIYAAVVANADSLADRTAQVNEILKSFSLSSDLSPGQDLSPGREVSLRRARVAARQSVCKPGGRFHGCRTLRCTRATGGGATCQVAYRYRSSRASGSRRYRCRARVKVGFRSPNAKRLAVSRPIGARCARVS